MEWTDWRFHIPDPIRAVWGKLSHEARLTAYVIGETRARETD
jgi:hypothetical protein